jgi:hypothetical protein
MGHKFGHTNQEVLIGDKVHGNNVVELYKVRKINDIEEYKKMKKEFLKAKREGKEYLYNGEIVEHMSYSHARKYKPQYELKDGKQVEIRGKEQMIPPIPIIIYGKLKNPNVNYDDF